jgi:simple sugar transport system substrate-binding protein
LPLRQTGHLAANNPVQIGVVGKVKIPWFDEVGRGVAQAGRELGVDAPIINPTTDDPADEVRAIEDLIAKKVDAIGVIPNDGKALEPVLGRAQAAGIKVTINESPEQKNAGGTLSSFRTRPSARPISRRSRAKANTWSTLAA